MGDQARCAQPGIGNTGVASAASLGKTTDGRWLKFCSTADPTLMFWPLASNLIGPPIIRRLDRSVWRMASARATGSVVPARLKASTATRIDSKVKPTLKMLPTSESFGNFLLKAEPTSADSLVFGLYQGTTDTA